MKILAIHGAWSSSTSFNYLRSKTKAKDWYCIDYDHRVNSWEDILAFSIGHVREPFIAVGHSLGGLAALHQTQDTLCRGIMTIASPLAGLDLNIVQQYLSRSTLMGKIASTGSVIREIHELTYHVPVVHLIATRGYNPFIYEPSDGVLPIKVQTGWTCGSIQEIPTNHYEILQSDATVAAVKQLIKTCS
jgi:pimeloyl-ACP methyl ester carboxylesterase